MINHRKLIMDVINGEAADFVPFAPRLDIWYRSNKMKGTLPKEYKHSELIDVIDDLEVGYNTMIPDFQYYKNDEDVLNRGLGIYWSDMAASYRVKFNVDRKVDYDNGTTTIEYATPYGNIKTKFTYNDDMKSQGITIPHISEKAIKSVDDYKKIAYIFNNAEVTPTYDLYNVFEEMIGSRGINTTIGAKRCSPMRLLQMELMPFELLTYEMYDHPDELKELCGELMKFIDKCVDAAVNSPAEVITIGAHFDSMLTYPDFYREHMLPSISKYAKKIHSKGKFMAAHTDSENGQLLDLYVESKLDVADSICTKPLTNQTYKQIRESLGNKVTLYGVIPSIATLKNSMSDYDFDTYINELAQDIQDDGGRNVILGIADTTPADAEISRIRKIAKISKQIKPK